MGLGAIFKTALLYTLIGMGTVFCVLIFISVCIWLLGLVCGPEKKTEKGPAAASAEPDTTEGIRPEVVAAVTAELPDESPLAPWRMAARTSGGTKAVFADGGLSLVADDATRDWAAARLSLPAPLPLDAGAGDASLVFEVNGGRTGIGTYDTPPPPFQVALNGSARDGAPFVGKYFTPPVATALDGDPATWQTVRIPLRRLLGDEVAAVTEIRIQFKLLPARRANLVLRRFRVE